MDNEQIAEAKGRAHEVVNGFKCPTERIAADAHRLACELEHKCRLIAIKDRQIAQLEKELADAIEQGKAGASVEALFGIFK